MDDFLRKTLNLLKESEKFVSNKKTFKTEIDLSYTYYPDSEKYKNELNKNTSLNYYSF